MHRLIQDHLEEVLSDTELPMGHPALQHLESCEECRDLVAAMQGHQDLFAAFQVTEPVEPAPGFYARVSERIEIQRPSPSVWDLFFESMLGRRLATVSFAFVMVMGLFLMTTEGPQRTMPGSKIVTATYPMLPAADFPDEVFETPAFQTQPELMAQAPGRDAILLDLVTYNAGQ